MSPIRSSSAIDPAVQRVETALHAAPALLGDVARTHARLTALGVGEGRVLVARIPSEAVTECSQALIDDLVALMRLGMSHGSAAEMVGPDTEPLDLAAVLRSIHDVTEHNPMPDTEWAVVRAVMTDELLETLLHVSVQSIRRYAAGERDTPDGVAARLHFVALVNADLAGSYNDRGIRRWWCRPRSALEQRSPMEVLSNGFDPDGTPAGIVRALSAALVGPGGAS